MQKIIFRTEEDFLDREFFEIYEENNEKRIRFSGYIYTNGEPGYNSNSELDEAFCHRIVEYTGGMDFSLKDYLDNNKLYEEAYEIRGNDYISDATREEAIHAANNWFGDGIEIKTIPQLTMETPNGCYVQYQEEELWKTELN